MNKVLRYFFRPSYSIFTMMLAIFLLSALPNSLVLFVVGLVLSDLGSILTMAHLDGTTMHEQVNRRSKSWPEEKKDET